MKDTAKQVSINPATRMIVTECEGLTERIHGFSVDVIELTQKAYELLKAALVEELRLKEASAHRGDRYHEIVQQLSKIPSVPENKNQRSLLHKEADELELEMKEHGEI